MNNETNESIVDEHIYIDSKGNEVGRRIAMPIPDIKPDANPSININPNIILNDAINDAQNALKGPKFATREALDENGNTCRGRDKTAADALFDTVCGLNENWEKSMKNGKK